MRDYLNLWLVRHGQSSANAEERLQGQSNSPLSRLGEAQAKALAKRLASWQFDSVWASDLERAYRTAQLALPEATIMQDKRLRERSFGQLEGKLRAELSMKEREELERWYTSPYRFRPDNHTGELQGELEARLQTWIADLPDKGRVIAFTHGGCIRALLMWLLDTPQHKARSLVASNTGVTHLEVRPERIRVLSINNLAHLDDNPSYIT